MTKIVTLEEVCEVIAGQSPPSSTYNTAGEGLPFFQGKADFGQYSPTVRIWCNSPQKIAEKGDILISVRAPVGPTNLCDQKACIGRGLSAIRAGNKIDNSYLQYFLKKNEKKLSDSGRGSTFSSITQKDLKQIQIPLPSLEEQKRIVRELDTADVLWQKRKQAIALLDDYLKAVFLEMFGDPVENPKGWETKEFSKICSKILGGGTPSKSNGDFYIGNIPWVTPKDMKMRFVEDSEDHISDDAVVNSSVKIIPQNSVLMVIRSGILKHTLPVAINYVEVTINQDMKAYVIDPKFSNPFFVLFFFEVYASHLLKKVRAVTADNIKFDDIKSILMLLPPVELQNKFADIVKKVETMRDKMAHQSSQFEENLNALMQRSFN